MEQVEATTPVQMSRALMEQAEATSACADVKGNGVNLHCKLDL